MQNHKHNEIHVLLHGGLGNQLFQYFTGCLVAERFALPSMSLITEKLEKYTTSRAFELQVLLENAILPVTVVEKADIIAQMRIPKIIWKFTKRELLFSFPGYGLIIDGYFQSLSQYQKYNNTEAGKVLEVWRHELLSANLLKPVVRQNVTHVRLGDFFRSSTEARVFARKCLLDLKTDTDLVTDQESLLEEEISKIKLPFNIHIIPSVGLTAWELISIFSEYRIIQTNGSSLAFWAAILSKGRLKTSNTNHQAIWKRLTIN